MLVKKVFCFTIAITLTQLISCMKTNNHNIGMQPLFHYILDQSEILANTNSENILPGLEDIIALSLTNKHFFGLVHNNKVTTLLLLKTYSRRFNCTELQAANEISTTGANQWIAEYLSASNFY